MATLRARSQPFPKGILGSSPLPPGVQKSCFFLACSKNPENVAKLPPRGSPNGARNLKNLKKMHSRCLLKRKLGKTPEIVRILTPSNPLKRAKTNTKTPFSRFHPDTKKSLKNDLKKGALGSQFGTQNEKKCPPRGHLKKRQKNTSENIQKHRKSDPNMDTSTLAFWALF